MPRLKAALIVHWLLPGQTGKPEARDDGRGAVGRVYYPQGASAVRCRRPDGLPGGIGPVGVTAVCGVGHQSLLFGALSCQFPACQDHGLGFLPGCPMAVSSIMTTVTTLAPGPPGAIAVSAIWSRQSLPSCLPWAVSGLWRELDSGARDTILVLHPGVMVWTAAPGLPETTRTVRRGPWPRSRILPAPRSRGRAEG
jgi:hypothetical protein